MPSSLPILILKSDFWYKTKRVFENLILVYPVKGGVYFRLGKKKKNKRKSG
jgi:hypothetical protein